MGEVILYVAPARGRRSCGCANRAPQRPGGVSAAPIGGSNKRSLLAKAALVSAGRRAALRADGAARGTFSPLLVLAPAPAGSGASRCPCLFSALFCSVPSPNSRNFRCSLTRQHTPASPVPRSFPCCAASFLVAPVPSRPSAVCRLPLLPSGAQASHPERYILYSTYCTVHTGPPLLPAHTTRPLSTTPALPARRLPPGGPLRAVCLRRLLSPLSALRRGAKQALAQPQSVFGCPCSGPPHTPPPPVHPRAPPCSAARAPAPAPPRPPACPTRATHGRHPVCTQQTAVPVLARPPGMNGRPD